MAQQTLDSLYDKYKGASVISFDGNPVNNGQCVQWALIVRTERDNLPVRFGNAIDWWTNRATDVVHYDYSPFSPGTYPKAGDYVVWGSGVGSQFGHIDLCALDGDASGFLGYDSNWLDIPKLTTVKHNYSLGILGYVRVKETRMNKSPDLNDGDIVNAMRWVGMDPDTDANKSYRKTWADIGDWNKWFYDFKEQPAVLQALADKYKLTANAQDAADAAKYRQLKQLLG